MHSLGLEPRLLRELPVWCPLSLSISWGWGTVGEREAGLQQSKASQPVAGKGPAWGQL